MAFCTATKDDGNPCKAQARGVLLFCRWHDPSDAARAEHTRQSQAGGFAKAYGLLASTDSLASDPALDGVDFGTPIGLRALLSATLRALTKLPFTVREANSISGLATSQRNVIESTDILARLEALEATNADKKP